MLTLRSALLKNLRGMSCSGAYWLLGGGLFWCRYGGFWMVSYSLMFRSGVFWFSQVLLQTFSNITWWIEQDIFWVRTTSVELDLVPKPGVSQDGASCFAHVNALPASAEVERYTGSHAHCPIPAPAPSVSTNLVPFNARSPIRQSCLKSLLTVTTLKKRKRNLSQSYIS